MKGKNLGIAISLLRKQYRIHYEEWVQFLDLSGYNCGDWLVRSQMKRMRLVRKRVRAITGMKYPHFLKEVRKRTSDHWMKSNMDGFC